MTDSTLIAVVGPTATGKTKLALELAERLGGEIVSVDSAQVFCHLDVGTAKPTAEEQARVKHHLIDMIRPDEQWSAADFQKAAERSIADVRARGKVPILCGGTGLWLRALTHGLFEAPEISALVRQQVRDDLACRGAKEMHQKLREVDPVAASRIEENDPQRIGRALEVFFEVGVPISELQRAHGFRESRHRLVPFCYQYDRETLWGPNRAPD